MFGKFAKLTTIIAMFTLGVLVMFPPVSSGQGKDRLERGRKLYVQYCASCHGMDAKGNGPVAAELKTAPTNLTTIAQRHGGKFNPVHIQLNINGENDVVAHGTKEMPVWGSYFRTARGQSVATLNIYALTEYLEAVQVK